MKPTKNPIRGDNQPSNKKNYWVFVNPIYLAKFWMDICQPDLPCQILDRASTPTNLPCQILDRASSTKIWQAENWQQKTNGR